MIEQILENLGLSKKEVSVLLHLMKLGRTKVSNIIKASNHKRATTYEILDSLKQQGLVVEHIDKKVIEYSSISPSEIEKIYEHKLADLKQVIPDLNQLFKVDSNQASIKIYSGRNGIKSVYNSIFDTPCKEILSIASNKNITKELGDTWVETFMENISETKIKVKTILNKDQVKYFPKIRQIKDFREERYLYNFLNFNADIMIVGSSVIFISFDKSPLAIKIDSEMISLAMKFIFTSLWSSASPSHD